MRTVAAIVTEEEHDIISADAAALGLSVSSYLRHAIVIARHVVECSRDIGDEEWDEHNEGMWDAATRMIQQGPAEIAAKKTRASIATKAKP